MHSSPIYSSVIEFFRYLPKKDLSLLIAVSGGSDSVALAYILHELSENLQLKKIAIAHVNHGLRGEESDGDEQLVREIAEKLKCKFYSKRLSDLSLDSSSLEESARNERYTFFQQLKKEHNFDYIVTAHTADDQAETVLFRMIRGSGINGLRAIQALRDDGVIRPLLSISKNELLSWLDQKGYTFRVDSTNSDSRFRRNYLRHKVLPSILEMDQSAVKKIAAIAEKADGIWRVVHDLVQSWIKEYVITSNENCFEIKKNGLDNKTVASEALYQLLKERGVDFSKQHITNLLLNSNRTSGQILFPQGWSAYPLKTTILFQNESGKKTEVFYQLKNPGITEIKERNIRIIVTESVPEKIEKNSDCAILDKEKCGDILVYRTICPDDYFIPLGRTKKTNALTFLSKQGMTKIERERVGVVVDSHNNLLWIPGIRINDSCRVTEMTTRVIKISFQTLCNIV